MIPRVSFIAGSVGQPPRSFQHDFTHAPLRIQDTCPRPEVLLRACGGDSGDLRSLSATVGQHSAVICGHFYNSKELADRLSRQGMDGHAIGVGELFLRLYLTEPDWLLANINAKFCAAILDGKQLRLVRDKMGEEQVYFGIQSGVIVFSSAIKDVAHSLALTRVVVPESMRVFETPINDETIVAGVHKVPPGTQVIVSLDDLTVHSECYWQIEERPSAWATDLEAIEEFTHLFSDALSRRIAGRIHFGAFLSGGQDSSYVVSMLAKLGHAPRSVFTVAWLQKDSIYNELPWAAFVAQAVGAEHIVMEPTAVEFRRHYPRVMRILDEMKGNAAHFLEYWTGYQASLHHLDTLFSGYGADEILGGEIRYLLMTLDRDRSALRRAIGVTPLLAQYSSLADKLFEVDESSSALVKYFHLITRAEGGSSAMFDAVARIFERHTILANQLGATDIGISAQPLLDSTKLLKYWGVDKVCPFLDYRLAAFAFSLPERLKIAGLETKVLLRRAGVGVVPDRIASRTDKVGFAFPFQDRDYAEYLEPLATALSARTGLMPHPDPVRGRFDRTTMIAASEELLRQFYEDGDFSSLS